MLLLKKKSVILVCFILLSKILFSQDSVYQTGYASYYSDAFQGRHTSSGEIYKNNLYTAAHASLPLHTIVKVTNLKNNKSVIVKINDRCVKFKSRIIDLSKSAANKIDLISSGIAPIKLEILKKGDLHIINDLNDSLLIPLKKDTMGNMDRFDIYSFLIKQRPCYNKDMLLYYNYYRTVYHAAYINIVAENRLQQRYFERFICMVFPPLTIFGFIA